MSDWKSRAIPVPQEEGSDWKSRATPVEQPNLPSKNAEAAVEGFGQQATMGYLPQLQAAVGGLIPNPSAKLDQQLQEQGFKISQPEDSYVNRRDQMIARGEQLQEKAPGAYLGGQVAGAIAGSAPTGAALGKVAPALLAPSAGVFGSAVKAAAGGALQGAAANPGDIKGQVQPLQISDRAQQALSGAAMGGLTGGALATTKKGADFIKNLPDTLKNYAELKAFKSTGAMLKDWRKANDFGKVNSIGKAMIKDGLVGPGSTFEDVAEKSAELKSKWGKIIGDTYDAASAELDEPLVAPHLSLAQHKLLDETHLHAPSISNDLAEKFSKELSGKAGGKKALGAISQTLEELAQNGKNPNINQLQDFKESLDDVIKYNRPLNDEPLTKQYLKKIRDELKGKIDARIDALDQIFGNERLKTLKEANKQYGIWAEVSRISKDRVSRENANQMFGLKDTLAALGGAGAGAAIGAARGQDAEGALKGAAMGAAMGGLNKVARTYGNPLLTQGAYGAGQLLSKLPPGIPTAVSQATGGLLSRPGVLGAQAAGLLNQKKNQR